MLFFELETYRYFESCSPFLNFWLTVFFAFTLLRISIFIITKERVNIYNSIIGEAAGILLVLNHTVCFVKSIVAKDIISIALFFWWGPGFFITGIIMLLSKRKVIDFNWAWYGLVTSIACKVNYFIFMVIYIWLGCYSIIFTFSIWIIHDQINLAWFCTNGDRTRRTFEDYWIVRIMYLAGLFIPFFVQIPHHDYMSVLGTAIFFLWLASVIRLKNTGMLMIRPKIDGNYLRNIVYLHKEK